MPVGSSSTGFPTSVSLGSLATTSADRISHSAVLVGGTLCGVIVFFVAMPLALSSPFPLDAVRLEKRAPVKNSTSPSATRNAPGTSTAIVPGLHPTTHRRPRGSGAGPMVRSVLSIFRTYPPDACREPLAKRRGRRGGRWRRRL